jgi:hypothetical protein
LKINWVSHKIGYRGWLQDAERKMESLLWKSHYAKFLSA